MKNLNFSVAMSVYKNDNPKHLRVAIESILEQTVKPNEIVLVVDGTVDEELDNVIKCYEQNELFNIIRLPENKGLGNALKVCLENSKYDLIARMDADDIAARNRFEQQLKYFEENEQTDIVGGDISEFVNEPENIIGVRCVPTKDSEIKAYMKKRCAFNHVSVMFKKSSVLDAGGYLDLFWNEDYYLWIRMWLNDCSFANTGTVLVNVRTGQDMYSRRGGKKYFKSELFLQNYMLKHKLIGLATYFTNILKRLIVQILLPNSIRGWIFRKFARKKV